MKTLKKSLFVVLTVFLSFAFFSIFAACSNDTKEDDKETTVTNKEGQGDSGTKTYFGTRAPTESKAVGDIVFSDGSATPYSEGLVLTSAQKSAAVAVIFYAGSVREILGQKILGVGLVNTQGEPNKTLAWAATNTTEFTEIAIHTVILQPTDGTAYYKVGKYYLVGDFDGSDNWTKICELDTSANESDVTNYPAFNWINNYAATNLLTGDNASGWYLPSVIELIMLYNNKTVVNNALEKVGGTKMENTKYWSSNNSGYRAEYVDFSDGEYNPDWRSSGLSVCAIREF